MPHYEDLLKAASGEFGQVYFVNETKAIPGEAQYLQVLSGNATVVSVGSNVGTNSNSEAPPVGFVFSTGNYILSCKDLVLNCSGYAIGGLRDGK